MPRISAYTLLQRDTDVLAKALSRKDAQPRPLATPVSSRRQAVYHDLPRSYAQIEHSVMGIWDREAEGAPLGGRPPLFAETIVAPPPGLPRSVPSRPTPGYRGCLRAIRLGRNLCCSISGAGFVSENLCALMASPLLQTPARAAPGARPGRNESSAEVFGSRRAASLYNTKRSPGDGFTAGLARGFPSEQVASVEESPGGREMKPKSCGGVLFPRGARWQ